MWSSTDTTGTHRAARSGSGRNVTWPFTFWVKELSAVRSSKEIAMPYQLARFRMAGPLRGGLGGR